MSEEQQCDKHWRKKPVVIEAVQWDESMTTLLALRAKGLRWVSHDGHVEHPDLCRNLRIRTLEDRDDGAHHVSPGDWIIKGVAGEFYACKPDIFAATYEPAFTRSHVERITPAELEHLIEWHDACAKFSSQSDNFSGETHHEARAAALRKVDELWCDIGARSAPSTTPRSEEAALAYKAFWDRHAKGSMLCPSCLMCGAPVAREQWAITHAELPDIFICACCVEKVRNPIDTPPSATLCIDAERYRFCMKNGFPKACYNPEREVHYFYVRADVCPEESFGWDSPEKAIDETMALMNRADGTVKP